MTIPTCSSFGLCKLSRILAGTHSFWDCRTVLFHWLTEAKRPPFLRARNLKPRTKFSVLLPSNFNIAGQHPTHGLPDIFRIITVLIRSMMDPEVRNPSQSTERS